MATQIIPFLEPFKLIIDSEYKTDNLTQDGLNSIGVLSSIARDCSDLVATFREGGVPTEIMLTQVIYSAHVLSGLAVCVSGSLSLEELSP